MNKFHSLLGFAQKAGKLVSGEEAVEGAVKKGSCFLVVLAQDSSDNTKRKFGNMAKHRGVFLLVAEEKETLGRIIGKPRRAVIGVLDKGFAAQIQAQGVRLVERNRSDANEEGSSI